MKAPCSAASTLNYWHDTREAIGFTFEADYRGQRGVKAFGKVGNV
jgi:hypothetical protein